VTGLGSPNAPGLAADLATFGTANHVGVSSQPPSNVIVGDRFGIVVEAEDPQGGLDPAFTGTLTISLDTNHPGATLGGTLTATAVDGIAVFDGLTLNQTGSGFTIEITSSKFPSITTSSFNAIADPTPWQGTFYPVPTDASLRNDIDLADSNADAFNTIILSASHYLLSNRSVGGIVIENTSSLSSKTLTIIGQGESSSIIGSIFNWSDRIFEIVGSGGQSLNVTLQGLTIEGGNALNGGVLGGTNALGGGLLIDDANVTLANDAVQNNQAQGAIGAAGAPGAIGAKGGNGGTGTNASGGGIYLASGTLSLFSDTINGNSARGGQGGQGGAGGGQGTKNAAPVLGGQGGAGGQGGSAAGGGLYAAGGTILLQNDTFGSNQAIGGPGGTGGTGGSGGHGKTSPKVAGKTGGAGGAGGLGGAAYGGAIYVAGGSLTLTRTVLQKNLAVGGAGGKGGVGGQGTIAVSLTGIFGGTGSTLTLGGFTGFSGGGGPGGDGGPGGAGGSGSGGGIYLAKGTVTLNNSTLADNQAIGGQGGTGGRGGTGGFGSATGIFGLPSGKTGGNGGIGGVGGLGHGGGIQVAGGKATLYAVTFNGNIARGGKGGAGGTGGDGPLAALGTGTLTGTGGTTGGTGSGGGGSGANSAGAGGKGGNGGTGKGGGQYVSGGALTLTNSTVVGNTVNAGAGGSGGLGGKAGTGTLTGGQGGAGNPGDSYGGGLYVNGGTVTFNNCTVALNIQSGAGSAGGVFVQPAGQVTVVSTLIGGNGAVDFSGAVTATDSLFQTAPINGTLSGSGNITGKNPLLNSNGLQSNGGPTQTIALQAGSPAIGAGTNPENLFTDQRGYAARTGPGGTDIGAYQTSAQADTQAPTATLQASAVTTSNAASSNPYKFSITFADNVAVDEATLLNALVEVVPPGAGAPIFATVNKTTANGTSDSIGNAQSFTVTYQITPPGGSWISADNGTYTVILGGGAVTDLAGNSVAPGTVGTFTVNLAAPYFVVTGLPGATTAGNALAVTVTAYNSNGSIDTGYTGTVDFTSSDPKAVLPAAYQFKAADAGAHTFSVTLESAGSQTVTATDSQTSSLNGGGTVVVSPGAKSKLFFNVQPASAIAGVALAPAVQVEILDAYNNLVTSDSIDSITIGLGLNPGGAALNGTTTEVVSAGIATFGNLAIDLAATYTLTAELSGVTGTTSSSFTISAAAAASLKITSFPSLVVSGQAETITLTLYDSFNNVATGYTGTVTFKSSDSAGQLPAAYTFVSGDAGIHTFGITLITSGTQSITAADTVTSSLTATLPGIQVDPAYFLVTGFHSPTTAGAPHTFTVTAENANATKATAYFGTIVFTSSDKNAAAILPGAYTFTSADQGAHTFSAALVTAGTQSLTATDAQVSAVTGSQTGIIVDPNVASKLIVKGFVKTTLAGAVHSFSVTVDDKFGNLATGYTGTVHFTSSDTNPLAVLPADYQFSAGDAGVHTFSAALVTVNTSGQSIVATDTFTKSITGSQTGIIVTPNTLHGFVVSGFHSPSPAGSTHSFTVMAADKYGNVIVGYTGTVTFTSNDHQAVLPANYTFAAADDGLHTFQASLRTAGSESIIATDTVTTSLTGKQSGIIITAGAAVKLLVTPVSTTETAGAPFNVTVTAKDFYGNIATTYTGTIAFTSSDKKAMLPANYTFTTADNGAHTFSVTLNTTGTKTITATDTVTKNISGKVKISVTAASAVAQLAVLRLASVGGSRISAPATARKLATAAAVDEVLRLDRQEAVTHVAVAHMKRAVIKGISTRELVIDQLAADRFWAEFV
jgi:hypothetical protein